MENELPKRLFPAGYEPEVDKINNNCRMSVISKVKAVIPAEYNELKNDSVFANILALYENSLGYSARLIHSMMCRQLITKKKYEIWCVFGGRPLRFSLQEFYAVTGLKYKDDDGIRDLEEWEDDNGFWSKLLKRKGKITIKMLLDDHLPRIKVWNHVDRIRFVYVCVIAGLVLAKHETKEIPHKYIKLVMDISKLQRYPWGLEAFELLANSIIEAQGSLKKKGSYVLNGFSYAFQIWVMEAIPRIGAILGKKLNDDFTEGPRCSNWTGAAIAFYEDIILLERSFQTTDAIHPYISFSGSFELCESSDFAWPKETRDATVDYLNAVIKSGNGFGNHVWASVETVETIQNVHEQDVGNKEKLENEEPATDGIPVSVSRRAKKRISDQGAVKRKQKILCQRVGENHGGLTEDVKSFIQDLFKGLEEQQLVLFKGLEERFVNLENNVSQIFKESLLIAGTKRVVETFQASKPSSNSQRKGRISIEDDGFPTQTSNKVHADVFREGDDILLSQPFDLNHTMGHLSQDTYVSGFDATQEKKHCPTTKIPTLEDEVWLQSLNSGRSTYHSLSFDNEPNVTRKDYGAEYPLVHLSEDCWQRLQVWSSGENKQELQLGPSIVRFTLLDRIIKRKSWFATDDMDAMMYIFRESTSLGRLTDARAGFMNCMFGMQITEEYHKFVKDRRQYKLPSFLLAYRTGELPSHGRTRKRWALEVDRIYVPLNVGRCHWISLCVSFIHRTIHVFDCSGVDNRKNVEAFKFLIPRILKAVQSGADAKILTVNPYSVINAPVKSKLNKSGCDCGAYALKYIECHLLGLDLSLLDDGNIREARIKIASDLCEAATDPILQARMLQYEPSQFDDTASVEIV